MTKRIKGIMITLKKDMREDDVDSFIKMLSLFPFIAEVKKSDIIWSDEEFNKSRIRIDYWDKIKKVLED